MPKKEDIYHSILIVSSSEQFGSLVKGFFSGFVTIDSQKSAAQARRCVLERYYDLILINSPLADETGEDFAIDVTESSNASVLLVSPREQYEEVLERLTEYGVLVLSKPLPRRRLDNAFKFLGALQKRIRNIEDKNRALEEKMEELRLVSKAKFYLVEEEGMTEDEAHKYIGKMAMDNGISRGKAARRILDDAD
ncbi:MAG: ANTAR domain-containing protein [Lachnospiraceae bacterium]|nr:ANTAR domain-containing protein [Lachnospiraceae bacterium]